MCVRCASVSVAGHFSVLNSSEKMKIINIENKILFILFINSKSKISNYKLRKGKGAKNDNEWREDREWRLRV